MTTTGQRGYGGVSADTRTARRREQFMRAGLELLGTAGSTGLTVRGVVERAQLAPRYFYENFPNIDALAVAVFEQVMQEMVRVGLAAIAQRADLRTRVRAGLTAVARLLTDDPRKGRVLLIESLSSPVLAPLRHNAISLIAQLVATEAHRVLGDDAVDATTIDITARFLVGGFSETVAMLINDPDHADRDAVVDRGTDLFLAAHTALTG